MRRQSRFRENVSSRAGSVSVFWQHAPLFWWSAGSASVFWLYALLCLAVRWLGQCFLAVCAFVFGGLLAPPPFFGSMRICFWWFAGSASVFWQHARLFLVIRWLHPSVFCGRICLCCCCSAGPLTLFWQQVPLFSVVRWLRQRFVGRMRLCV